MSNVVELPIISRIPEPAEKVLRKAIEDGLQEVIIIGYDKNDVEYMTGNIADGAMAVWLAERLKQKVLNDYEYEDE